MIARIARATILLMILLAAGCGGDGLLFPTRKEVSELEIKTLESGTILFEGETLPLEIVTEDREDHKTVDVSMTVSTLSGVKVWESRLPSSPVNEPLPPILLPGMKEGQYKLELSVSTSGGEPQKKTVVFFRAGYALRIAGIKSFPAGITVSSPVLLKADIEAPAAADPYLRWTWRGKSIGEGFTSKGTKDILWSVPEEEGVYTVTLEAFPTEPAAVADVTYKSSVAMSADIYVTAGKPLVLFELPGETSYYALYHFRADYRDSGTAEKKTAKTEGQPVGTPEIVATEYGFGYRLHDGAGIRFPWAILPADAGVKRPFTLSLSVRLESAEDAAGILHAGNADGTLSVDIDILKNPLSPQLAVSSAGASILEVPSNAVLENDRRYLLSITITPLASGGFAAQWFVDGKQTAAAESKTPFPEVKEDFAAVLGGKAFKGTVDELGVYVRDEKGKDSPDSSLFRREAQRTFGESLLLAEGFDGTVLPQGFSVDIGSQKPVLGSLILAPGSSLTLPALKTGTAGLDMEIALGSAAPKEVLLSVRYKGEEDAALETAVPSDGGIEFGLRDGVLTFKGADGTDRALKLSAAKKTDVVLTLTNPKEPKTPLSVESILSVRPKE